MILDSLSGLEKFKKVHSAFPAAFNFLKNTDFSAFTSGHRTIVEGYLYATSFVRQGVGMADARLLAHRKCIEIQFSVNGIDNIGWRPVERCLTTEVPYNEEQDRIIFDDVPETWFGLVPGTCAIFFPEDAYAPLAVNGTLHKVIINVGLA